jgi:hypothetical protein
LPERRERIRREIQSLGVSLLKAGVVSLVVDTQNRFTADDSGRFLADALGGAHVRLPQMLTEDVSASLASGNYFDE